jgi:hypothetical protein
MRCLARETQLAAAEALDTASQARERAQALVKQAGELMAEPRSNNRICPVCDRPLTDGGSVLFQGDVLVHALCWRMDPPPPIAPPPAA